jgi:hypothetical protein
MISHSLITVAWMTGALAIYAAFGLSPWFAALFILGVWWSREQYWEELKLRQVGRRSLADVIVTMVMVFRPMRRNMDLFAPAAVAVVMAVSGQVVL